MEIKEHRPIVLQDGVVADGTPKSAEADSVSEGSNVMLIELGTVTGSTKSGGSHFVPDNVFGLSKGI